MYAIQIHNLLVGLFFNFFAFYKSKKPLKFTRFNILVWNEKISINIYSIHTQFKFYMNAPGHRIQHLIINSLIHCEN